MLNRVSAVRHVIVGVGVVGVSLLGALGIVGAGDQGLFREEHFDAKEVTVSPVGASNPDGLRIREVVDIDFGLTQRRGYQRIIPNDFGVPTDILASSPDANAEVAAVRVGRDTRVRVGNPLITFDGQRRYVLEYTLPEASLSEGVFALDIIGTDETFTTDRFVVNIVGLDLKTTSCDTGSFGDFGGCTLERVDDGWYRTEISPLKPGEGITVSGVIDGVVDAEVPDVPDLAPRNPSGLQPIGLAQLGLGTGVAAAVFVWFRRRGSNDVFGTGGAADAAFGASTEAVPVPATGDPLADVPTHRVPDSRLAELATVEFSPPRGIEPWQGNVLLRERIGDEAVSAWFSEMVARGAIEITGSGTEMVLRPGQTTARLSSVDRGHLASLFAASPAVSLGSYNSSFTKVWAGVKSEQKRFIKDTGWWEKPIGSIASGSKFVALVVGFTMIPIVLVLAAGAVLIFGAPSGVVSALVLTLLVASVFAGLAYQTMLASRTATGSALTLRTESFRRFLDASEGRHVDWAWEHGLIREYSAWAVALGAADAWTRAIESSNITHPEQFTTPLLLHTAASTFSSTHTAPSSSGSGGGGGVGGGGGGGSSGSW